MALMVFIAGAAVKLEGRVIARVYFEMKGLDSQLARAFLDKLDGAPAYSLPPVSRFDIQFVDEGVHPVVFEAETQCKHDIAGGSRSIQEYPGFAESGVGEKCPQGVAHSRLVKKISSRLLLGQGAHHAEKVLFIRGVGRTKKNGSHAIHRSAREVWRRGWSNQSGDLPLCQY